MIEFRDLRYFLVACEHESLGLAAKHIGIASSTLSASLKSLESELGAPLLRKLGSGITPLPSARWVYRSALPLLMLERFAVNSVRAKDDAKRSLLNVDIDLTFTFSKVATAISHAAARGSHSDPLAMINPSWVLEDNANIAALPSGALDFAHIEHAHVFIDTTGKRRADAMVLLVDPWVLVRRNPAQPDAASLHNLPVALPDLPAPLLEQAQAYLWEQGVRDVRLLKEHPCALPELQHEYFDLNFMIPASILAARLNVQNVEPLDPPLSSRLMGIATGEGELGRTFLENLRSELNDPSPPFVFEPVLTGRRIRYFNLTHDLGRVSAAARSASIAQPALSQQLRKLELSLETTLFRRESAGLVSTASGRKLAPSAKLLEQRLRELSLSGKSASLSDGGQLSIGILPSVNQHDFLVNRVTEALLQLRDRYPAVSLTIREAPKTVLQDWISRGRLGLAIVETRSPQFPRFTLDSTEELAVIANPRFNLLPQGPVTFRDAAKLPLALPTSQFGLRQLLDTVAKDVGVQLKPRHQIDALALLVGFISREPICTVLPASSVHTELRSGELSAHLIVEPKVKRDLYLVYSGERSLTPAERELVTMLRQRLSTSSPQLAAAPILAQELWPSCSTMG